METKAILVLLLPLFALLAVLGWALLLVRLGKPVKLSLRGLGVQFELSTTSPKE